MPAASIAILISIAAAIALGSKLKVNIGLLAIFFAYVSGVFILGGTPDSIIALWPSKLFFQLFNVTLFYAFAINNGTVEAIAQRVAHASRGKPWLIPIALWLLCFILAGVGPGSLIMFMVLPPILMRIAEETGMDPLLAAVVFVTGSDAGAWSPIAVNGIVTKTLIEASGNGSREAADFALFVWAKMLIACLLLFTVCYFALKGHRLKAPAMARPAALTREQAISSAFIAALLALLVLPPVLERMTGLALFGILRNGLDITFLAAFFSIACVVLKVGDFKKALSGVPWNTLLMVCGTGTLIAVAAKSGALDSISSFIGEGIPAAAIPYAICAVSGAMSLFSSTMGVVVPTMYPLITGIASVSGAAAGSLYAIVPIAAAYTGFSPFSTAGAMSLAAVADDEARGRLFGRLIWIAALSLFYVSALILAGVLR
jgi:di/tricarboxylate transporter